MGVVARHLIDEPTGMDCYATRYNLQFVLLGRLFIHEYVYDRSSELLSLLVHGGQESTILLAGRLRVIPLLGVRSNQTSLVTFDGEERIDGLDSRVWGR